MEFSASGFIYQTLIDPLLAGLREDVLLYIRPSDRIIDVACGTGALSLSLAGKAFHVTGADLSNDMIVTAARSARKKGIMNVHFMVHNASRLSDLKDHKFDVAVTSMAIQQFEEELAVQVIIGMRTIASKIIIADYNYPMPEGIPRWLAYTIEKLAGGDHYRNFMNFMKKGGIPHFAKRAGLTIASESVRSIGVFRTVVCE